MKKKKRERKPTKKELAKHEREYGISAVPPLPGLVPWSKLKPNFVRHIFMDLFGGAVLADLLKVKFSDDPNMNTMQAREYGAAFAREVTKQAKCRDDPLEHALVMQLMMAHARAAFLTNQLSNPATYQGLTLLCTAAERAANSVRRMAMALREYRSPRPSFTTVHQVHQLNAAHQQIVQSPFAGIGNEKKCANKLQDSGSITAQLPAPASTLQADSGGVGGEATARGNREAVAVEHGATNAGGKGPRIAKRAQTRVSSKAGTASRETGKGSARRGA